MGRWQLHEIVSRPGDEVNRINDSVIGDNDYGLPFSGTLAEGGYKVDISRSSSRIAYIFGKFVGIKRSRRTRSLNSFACNASKFNIFRDCRSHISEREFIFSGRR